MIQLTNVTKYFKTNGEKKYILKDINFTIPDGVNLGILGRNGAGKSTFLRMLGGIDFPTSGEIVSSNSFSWPMGLSGGFQGSMTGRQNVKFVARVYGKNDKEINKIIESVQEFAEIGDYFDMPIKIYSSGMKSRLSFGLSLAFDFDYLIIDETLSVGDQSFKEKAKKALHDKISQCNILLVSHSMRTLKELCKAGVVLNDGKIEYFEDIKDAIKTYYEQNHPLIENENTVYCSDGNKFESVKDAASYYEVVSSSINQAINKNEGSHMFLKRVFSKGKKELKSFQQFQNMRYVASDGMCFRNKKQIIDYYAKIYEIKRGDIRQVLESENKYLEEIDIEFFTIGENI